MATKIVKLCDYCGDSKEYGIEKFYMTRGGTLYNDTNDVDPEKCKEIDLCWKCIMYFMSAGMNAQNEFI